MISLGFRKFFIVNVFFLLLGGCTSDHSDLNAWVQEQRNSARPRIQKIAEPLVFTPQAYASAEGMAPFSLSKLTQVLSKDSMGHSSNIALLNVEKSRQKEDLESYPLDAIVMVGTIKKESQDNALLKVNNLIYPVKIGGYIGQNYGRILNINEQSIKLREVVQDPAGDWVERITTLDLQEEYK